ncbi:MAG: hypothetical protein HY655_04895, partial [Acidobacteria bacterium]|nr:hypothetical protein [Acidobacteriota bacterium]
MPSRISEPGALGAFIAYTLLTLVLTWPLARGLTRDVPGDFIDPLLNTWIVSWGADHVERALTGDPGALGEYWHANIFAPHRFALAYSEHLTPQTLQILPVYVISRNPILCYNLLFLSTFVLSAFGMFLFVRELTGSTTAAFLGGLAFGFAPYRMGKLSHLQVLSSAWMPFALYFFRRFFVTRRIGPLAGGAASWIAQNLSCGYYLLFFSPLVGLYLLWELTVRRLWTDRRTLTCLGAMTAAVVALTMPFLWPYLRVRQLGFSPRSLVETSGFGADVYGFFTADSALRFWGSVARAWPTAEGALFPGLIVTVLSAVAVVEICRSAHREAAAASNRAALVLALALGLASIIAIALLLGWSARIPSSRPLLRITSFPRALTFVVAIAGLLLVVSAGARSILTRVLASPAGFFCAATLFAAVMALGPDIYARGRLIADAAPY